MVWLSLLAMPEIKREQVLADRAEVVRQSKERALLAQMVKQNRGMAMDSDDDSVRPAKRMWRIALPSSHSR